MKRNRLPLILVSMACGAILLGIFERQIGCQGLGLGGEGSMIGGAVGGGAGGILGQILIPIPGLGYLIGSAVGGLAGAGIGHAFDTPAQAPQLKVGPVNVEFDPDEAARQVADAVTPQLLAIHGMHKRAMKNAADHQHVSRALKGPHD